MCFDSYSSFAFSSVHDLFGNISEAICQNCHLRIPRKKKYSDCSSYCRIRPKWKLYAKPRWFQYLLFWENALRCVLLTSYDVMRTTEPEGFTPKSRLCNKITDRLFWKEQNSPDLYMKRSNSSGTSDRAWLGPRGCFPQIWYLRSTSKHAEVSKLTQTSLSMVHSEL